MSAHHPNKISPNTRQCVTIALVRRISKSVARAVSADLEVRRTVGAAGVTLCTLTAIPSCF
ncbi:MAG: hypothetical protein IPJ82_18540 [Lewinellaceae bacterium]|nr:hypothetical protein [Lewinellaceae bacterium]